MIRLSLSFCWLLVLVPLAAHADDPSYPRAELLVEPQQLAAATDTFIVLDARSEEAYAEGHIPAARWVDHDAWAKDFEEGQDAVGWSERIGKLGIDGQRPVVVYDDQAMKNAARIWWILRYWGVSDVRLLQGGWKQWHAEQLKTSSEAADPAPVEFTAKAEARRLARKPHVLDYLQAGDVQVVDARSADEFCGILKLKNERGGAIPGAKHLEWSELVDQETHRFKSAAELEQLFTKAGIDVKRPTASHCQSGGRASVMVFGLELMGATDARNYYRGWSEWGNAEDTPVEVRKSPDDTSPVPAPAPTANKNKNENENENKNDANP